ncbi:ABC transporter substrate-binding protein [Pseudoroseomonas wenyumeiae]|uniref:ABC transporter substrate-binding protein n=1 Tax=Teichococcus wenyumeiae TaxID=2478470 RepID=A0A3A9JC35_9PROT|nr:ABC transporter substrate-binding protein [Pseudoroseomonas wenyumeiae]RKK02125.1 ABC transporter substrate-binding protein [Pseudoroseomonas wenyumeiae]RMI15492.1 ABC transporter substrate-binding protein [Pseudoroseomonas wenyumeiae]
MFRNLSMLLLCGGIASGASAAETPLKIGVLTDMSGVYADAAGQGSVTAAEFAIADYASKLGLKVEVVSADHQNKADVGAATARRWYDTEGVQAIFDVTTSSVALAVNQIAREKRRAHINSGAATADLTGAQCSPYTVHWTYDTYSQASGTAAAVTRQGGDSWFFLTADYAFGHAMEREARERVLKEGGRVLGAVRTPFPTADYSSFLLQAQGSRSKVIGFANAGGDAANAVKQAGEFGVGRRGTKLAALLLFITEIRALGLEAAQGLLLTEAFYWDMNDGTRDFARRFAERHQGRMPTMIQAGVYASLVHYMKGVAATGSADAAEVVAWMKANPSEDALFGKGTIRQDGRAIHDMYLFEVKTPAESRSQWDLYKLQATIPGDAAFRPLEGSDCPLVTK